MSKPVTKNQHFVPQFYLRNFVNKANELHIFDVKSRRKMKPRGAGGVCAEDFFYGVKTGVQDEISQQIEEFFTQNIETPLSIELPKIIAKLENDEEITDEEKYILATLMSTMWLRGPAMRNQINRMEEQVIRQMQKIRYSHPSIDANIEKVAKEHNLSISAEERERMKEMVLKDEYTLEFPNSGHLGFMLDAENLRGFTNLFFGQYWIVHVSKTERQFVTSDNPITVIVPNRGNFFYGASFLERTHIFPLTPNLAIEAKYPHNQSGKKIKRKTYFKGGEGKIDEINIKVADQAKFVYSSREDEISWFDNLARGIERTSAENIKRLTSLRQKLGL